MLVVERGLVAVEAAAGKVAEAVVRNALPILKMTTIRVEEEAVEV